MAALRTMYQKEPMCLEGTLQKMVDKGTLSEDMLEGIKGQKKG